MSDKTQIQITKRTANRLFALKDIGDTYDDVINMLLDQREAKQDG